MRMFPRLFFARNLLKVVFLGFLKGLLCVVFFRVAVEDFIPFKDLSLSASTKRVIQLLHKIVFGVD